MTGFGTRSVPAGRKSSMRGRKSQSFQARAAFSEPKLGADGSGPVASRMKAQPKSERAAELRFAKSGWGAEHIARLQQGVMDRERVQAS